ncbi:MAG: gamma-glutamyl-gamma-aminobutyrate hydrolase family protein [Gammaproteobacteria bacterium SHHR-1]
MSQRVDVYVDRRETRDALDQDLVLWLAAAGYLAYPVPNALCVASEVFAWLEHLKPCGLVLSGGNDIGTMARRDFTEEIMLKYAERERLPLLGICRGMQMLAYTSFVPLTGINGHVRTRHQLEGDIQGEANSYHSLALAECPMGYRVLARSEDASIEAIRRKDLPWEGWMWHPERESSFCDRDLERLKGLFG